MQPTEETKNAGSNTNTSFEKKLRDPPSSFPAPFFSIYDIIEKNY